MNATRLVQALAVIVCAFVGAQLWCVGGSAHVAGRQMTTDFTRLFPTATDVPHLRVSVPAMHALENSHDSMTDELQMVYMALSHEKAERRRWDLRAIEDARHREWVKKGEANLAAEKSHEPPYDTTTTGTIKVTAAVVYCDKPALVNGANASEVLKRKKAGAFFSAWPVMPGDAEAAEEVTSTVAEECSKKAACAYQSSSHVVPILGCDHGRLAIDYTCMPEGGAPPPPPRSTVIYLQAASEVKLDCTVPAAPRLHEPHVDGVQPVRYAKDTDSVHGRSKDHTDAFRVWPIQFSVPAHRWRSSQYYKLRPFSGMVPGNLGTYDLSFHHAREGKVIPENVYFEQYATSYFCVTRKKMGWDTLRHIEIFASGCVPYFVDLHRLPASTLPFFPRDLVWEAMHLPGVKTDTTNPAWYTTPEAFSIDFDVFNKTRYFELAAAIQEHARRHLTSEAMTKYILKVLAAEGGIVNPKKILFVHQCFREYLSDSTYLGLKQLVEMGELDTVDDIVADQKFHTDPQWGQDYYASFGCEGGRKLLLHGRPEALDRKNYYKYETGLGHANALNLPPNPVDAAMIEQKLKNQEYDVVIFGAITRTTYLVKETFQVYPRNRVAILRGGDFPDADGPSMADVRDLAYNAVVFTRELFDNADGVTEHTAPQANAPGMHDTAGFHCCDMKQPRIGAIQHIPNPKNPQTVPFEGDAGWRPVGAEDDEVQCRGKLRYGNAEKSLWSVVESTGAPTKCKNRNSGGPFEDVAPGLQKKCECFFDSPWTSMGKENDVIKCHGHARFGSAARHAWSRITFDKLTEFKCKNDKNGGPFSDPISGVGKECECMWFSDPAQAGVEDPLEYGQATNWEFLGYENAMVKCKGVMRFGDPVSNAWTRIVMKAEETVICKNSLAGGPFEDPAPGKAKQCQCAPRS